MKQTSIFVPLLLSLVMALCLLMLTGCVPAAPETGAATTPETTQAAVAQTEPAIPMPTGSFMSQDGSVEFTWNLAEVPEMKSMPVVEVKPHFLTGEDMKNICTGLLGDVPFYDLGPRSQRQYSREQIQKKIDIMNLYPDQETLMDLWRSGDDAAQISSHRRTLEYLQKTLETAPEKHNLQPCHWQIQNERFYDDYLESDGMETLRATANVNGIDYNCDLYLSEEPSDYYPVSNWMKLSLGDGSDCATVDFHTRSQLCTSPEPTAAQYEAVVQKAQAMLDAMGIGDYKAVNPRYDPNYFGGDENRFEIYVDVVPVFEGVSALPGHWGQTYLHTEPQLTDYRPTRGMFSFSPNGDLIHFDLGDLVEKTRVVDPAAQPLPLSELLSKAQSILTDYNPDALRSSASYMNLWRWEYDNEGATEMTCKVDISAVDYGLVRYSADESQQTFIYSPAIICKGTVEYYDKETGALITSSKDTSIGVGQAPLIILDALGGGVI